jgi:hypothetical protein
MKSLILGFVVAVAIIGCGKPDPEPQPGPGPGPGPDKTFTLQFKQLKVSGEILPGAKVTVAEAKSVITTEVTKLEQ